jgi:hypothetical protein
MRRHAGFFDVDDRSKRLSDLGDQLEAFEAAVEFEAFRPELNAALTYSDGTQGGRPPFDPVMMFKILVIQTTPQYGRFNRSVQMIIQAARKSVPFNRRLLLAIHVQAWCQPN